MHSRQSLVSKEVLLDFSLTVKATTLIFIYWCGSAISSAKEGKSSFIYILKRKSFATLGVVRLFHLLRKGNQVLFIY